MENRDEFFYIQIGKVDVLLLPVGGLFTIDADTAVNVVESLKPAVTVPMHYKTDKCKLPIAMADEFTKNQKRARVVKKQESEVEIMKKMLPKDPEIIILQHLL